MNHPFVSQKLLSNLKREAKILSKESSQPLRNSLNTLSKQSGFHSWHHLRVCEEKTKNIIANSIILVFNEDAQSADLEKLIQHDFQPVGSNKKIQEVIAQYHESGFFWYARTERYLENNFIIFINNTSANKYNGTDMLSVFIDKTLTSKPYEVLFRGLHIDYDADDVYWDEYYSGILD